MLCYSGGIYFGGYKLYGFVLLNVYFCVYIDILFMICDNL